MRKSSTHFPLLLALTLATGCSPIAHINFPDGSAAETPDAGAPVGAKIANQRISLTLSPAPKDANLVGMSGQHGPLPSIPPGTAGIVAGSTGVPCPTELMGSATVNFSYTDKCSKGSSIHHVICKYMFDESNSRLSGKKPVLSLKYHENGVWPYVIHSENTGTYQFNALQALGTVRVIYKKPGQTGAELESKLISSSKQDPATLVGGKILESAEKLERDTVISFPSGLTVEDIKEIDITASVHCSVWRDAFLMGGGGVHLSDEAKLFVKDDIKSLSWTLGGFSVDVVND